MMTAKLGHIATFVLATALIAGVAPTSAQTTVSGTIGTDTVWTTAGSPYIVTSNLYVQGTDGPDGVTTLTIDPGVEVRFQGGTALWVGWSFAGGLSANGTTIDRIRFTSDAATPATGDWSGIRFGSNADPGTQISQADIEFAGGNASYPGVIYAQANAGASLDNVTFSSTADHDVYLGSSSNLTVTGCQLGSVRYADTTPTATWNGNTFDNWGATTSIVSPEGADAISHGNTFLPVAGATLDILAGTIGQSMAWAAAPGPYVVQGSLYVQHSTNNPTLTLEPGVELRFTAGTGLWVGYSYPGRLIANGDAAGGPARILLTSANPAPTPGDWYGVVLGGNTLSGSLLRNAQIEYGGSSASWPGGLTAQANGQTTLIDVVFANNDRQDIYLGPSANLTILNSTLSSFRYADETVQAAWSGNSFVNWGATTSVSSVTGAAQVSQGNSFMPVPGATLQLLAGTVSQSATWSADPGPYVLQGSIYVQASTGNPQLTLQPGVELRFPASSGLWVGTSYPGRLIADGNASGGPAQVRFTSAQITPAPGDWIGVILGNQSLSGTLLRNVKIEYAGLSASYPGALYVYSNGGTTVDDAVFENNDRHDIYLAASSILTVNNSTLGSLRYGDDTSVATWDGNSFVNWGATTSIVSPLGADEVSHGNVFLPVPGATLQVLSDSLAQDASWSPEPGPYVPLGNLYVQGSVSDPTLTLEHGVEMRFLANSGLFVGVSYPGGFAATGAHLTSAAPVPTAGAWYGVEIGTQGRSTLVDVSIDFADIALEIFNDPVSVTELSVREANTGLRVANAVPTLLTGLRCDNCDRAVEAYEAPIRILGSELIGTTWGVENQTPATATVDARDNWWGAADGPSGVAPGSGSPITSAVLYTPVLGAPVNDCDGDGLSDACELSCGAPGGPCDLPGCGTETDCDGNAVPDSCDLAAWPGGCDYPVRLAGNTTSAADTVFLGAPDGAYWGLGGQVVTYELDCGPIVDGPGPDFTVYEIGGDEFSTIDVRVSQDGLSYVSVIDDRTLRVPVPGDSVSGAPRSFDLRSSGLKVVRFVQIDGNGSGTDGSSTGFDLDALGVVNGLSLDCDASGTPDACDPGDCNANGVPESCELALGLVDDCNANSTPDTCDTLGASSDCDGDRVPDECEADCNGNAIPDDCDLAAMTSDDCDGNVRPDECDLLGDPLAFDSGPLTPIGRYSPRSSTLVSAPGAAGDVTLTVTALGDFDASNEYLDIDLNGIPLERVFGTGGLNCTGDSIQIVIPAATFNLAVAAGDAVFTAVASTSVNSAECSESTVSFDVAYAPVLDCNTNGTLDTCDVVGGFSADLNQNTLADECEPDCNSNGTPDDYDVLQGLSPDCNGNLNPDECDVASAASADCNTDDVPDECQPDCNTNGVPDDCDIAGATSQDCDGNDLPDECDLALAGNCVFGSALLDDATGQGTSAFLGPPDDIYYGIGGEIATYELNCGVIADGPGPDFNIYEVDTGSEEFHLLDDVLVSQDGINFVSVRATEDAAPTIPGDATHAQNRFARSYDLAGSGFSWTRYVRLDGAGGSVPGPGTGFDLDAMGAIHLIDRDCDDSGTLDRCESAADCDGSGFPDSCEVAILDNADCNANTTLDTCDIEQTVSEDCDGDRVPDECQIDCDANGSPDTCDITAGNADCNANARLDSCEFPLATVMEDLGSASPLNYQLPIDFTLAAPFAAGGPVTITITATGDYDAATEWLDVELNGTAIGLLFATAGTVCTERTEAVVISATQFNGLVGNGDATITLSPSSQVQSYECDQARGQVELAYDTAQDCNVNSAIDFCDIDDGSSDDCDADGVPDECQPDCNTNGVADTCDIASAFSPDCDSNGIPDECDLIDPLVDCNMNGTIDTCDIDLNTSSDCNDNGVPDECDLGSGTSQDCNADDLPDECPACPEVEVVFVMDTSSSMSNEAAVLCASLSQIVADLEADLVSVRTELNAIEVPGTGSFSCLTESVALNYGTTVPGSPPPGNEILGDCPGGNQVASEDWGRATSVVAGVRPWRPDSARLIVPIADEGPWCGDPATDPGADRDAINHAIITATANGVIVSPITGSGSSGAVVGMANDLADNTGGTLFSSTDAAADLSQGIRDVIFQACDAYGDCNANDVPDSCDIGSGTSQDCDLDGTPDECQADCNGNGVLDSCDIDEGSSLDGNGNLVPDECEEILLTFDDTQMLWTSVPQALGYDIVDGELDRLRAFAGDFANATTSCSANDHPTTVLPQGPDPGPGDSYYYLVRAVLATGPLSYDVASSYQVGLRDAEIMASGNDCP